MDDEEDFREVITDDELTALALSADPHPVLDVHAVPWGVGEPGVGPLPEWYMPVATGSRRGTATKVAVGIIIASFVLINALGLCVTYGWVTVA